VLELGKSATFFTEQISKEVHVITGTHYRYDSFHNNTNQKARNEFVFYLFYSERYKMIRLFPASSCWGCAACFPSANPVRRKKEAKEGWGSQNGNSLSDVSHQWVLIWILTALR